MGNHLGDLSSLGQQGLPRGMQHRGYKLWWSVWGEKGSSPAQVEKTKVLVAQSCPTHCDPMDWSPPGSSVHGIFQARVLEWSEKQYLDDIIKGDRNP